MKDKLTQIVKQSIYGRVDLHTANMLVPNIVENLMIFFRRCENEK